MGFAGEYDTKLQWSSAIYATKHNSDENFIA